MKMSATNDPFFSTYTGNNIGNVDSWVNDATRCKNTISSDYDHFAAGLNNFNCSSQGI